MATMMIDVERKGRMHRRSAHSHQPFRRQARVGGCGLECQIRVCLGSAKNPPCSVFPPVQHRVAASCFT